jgi:hypothetical protein
MPAVDAWTAHEVDSLVRHFADKGNDCFIATAAHGSPSEADVRTLRTFRDECLLETPGGRAFVSFYYAASPPLADCIADRPRARAVTRVALAPVVAAASVLTGFRRGWNALLGGGGRRDRR